MKNSQPNADHEQTRLEVMASQAFATIERTLRATYSQLDGCMEEAKRLIPVGSVGQLLGLLQSGSIESKRFVLNELIKIDMLSAHKHGISRDLEFYLPHCQEVLGPDAIPIDLVLTELQLKIESGQVPVLADYQQRFPQWAEALADMHWGRKDSRIGSAPTGLPEFEVGQAIDDFRIIRCLGRGAFAQVYLARQESMQRLVALKVSTQGSEEPQTLSQLDHPNIVRVYDQRALPQLGVHLLYMQAILGGTLARVIQSTSTLALGQLTGSQLFESIDGALVEAQQQPPGRNSDSLADMGWATVTAWLGAQLADGLQSAHDQDVLHCDVKPANILLSPSGQPKLADFNVSDRGVNAIRERRDGGTLPYMAPEHLAAASSPQTIHLIDHRSDLYSLALVLWELWQGRRPWVGSGAAETWRSAIHDQMDLRSQPLQCVREDVSPEGGWLQKVLRQCLDSNPDRRPQSCHELATRLRLALYPELVARFTPAPGTLTERLSRWPVLLVTALIVFTTNGPAGVLNFVYNREVIVRQYDQLLPHFNTISTLLNFIAFPVGGVLLVWFCLRVSRSLRRASQGIIPHSAEVDWLWRFGHRAALISAGLWLTFGVIFPVVLQRYQPELSAADFLHFFLSLAVCGGIALIYPFFGISLLATCVYYPQLLLPSMKDVYYPWRANWLRRHADFYLALAAIVPLLAILLLVLMRSQAPLTIQVLLVLITLVNLFVSFQSHRYLNRVLDHYSLILVGNPSQAGPERAHRR